MKKIPEFKSADEFEFWSTADSTQCVDWSQATRAKSANLNPTLAAEQNSDVVGPETV